MFDLFAIFSEIDPSSISTISGIGSASLAATAVYWLYNKNEKERKERDKTFADCLRDIQMTFRDAIEKIDNRQQERDKDYQELAIQKITAINQLSTQLTLMDAKLDKALGGGRSE